MRGGSGKIKASGRQQLRKGESECAYAAAGRASPTEPCAVFCLLHFKVGGAWAGERTDRQVIKPLKALIQTAPAQVWRCDRRGPALPARGQNLDRSKN